MKNLFLTLLILLSVSMSYAQIGIGTTDPKSTLQIEGEALDDTKADGLIIPKLKLSQLEAKMSTSAYGSDQDGAMVYVNDVSTPSTLSETEGIVSKGLYIFYHDGTTGSWKATGENKLWSTRGNANTDEATDFIGTTDGKALNFRVNNVNAGRIGLSVDRSVFLGYEAGLSDNLGSTWNTFVGFESGRENTSGFDNTAFGNRSLYSNTIGSNNTANGSFALRNNTIGNINTANGSFALRNNTTGSSNTANGAAALQNNTTGSDNTANGYNALFANNGNSRSTAIGYEAMRNADDRTSGRETFNTAIGYQALFGSTTAANNTGRWNTAFGDQALFSNSTGEQNTAIGYRALFSNTTGNNNTANGRDSLGSNTTGGGNTAIGSLALNLNTTGIHNTAIGNFTLLNNETGSENTAIGYLAFLTGNYTNSTALGFNARPNASNTIRLGNNAVSTIGGYANWTNVSDARFKQNIRENVVGLEFIKKLRPVTYNIDVEALARFNKTPDSLRLRDAEQLKAAELQTGFIAQEVEQAAKEVGYDFHGVDKPKNTESHYGLRYAEFVVPLVKAVQEQQAEIEALKMIIDTQQNQINTLTERLDEQE